MSCSSVLLAVLLRWGELLLKVISGHMHVHLFPEGHCLLHCLASQMAAPVP